MKILITGATGMIGKALIAQCLERGIQVHFLTRKKEKLGLQGSVQGFYWNPQVNEIDLKSLEGVSSVVNLAGSPIAKRWSPAYKEAILNSRINSLKTLHGAIKKVNSHHISSVVSASAIGIYPHSPTNFYAEADKLADAGFLGQVVGAWEAEANALKALNVKVAIMRIGLVLSTEGGALPKLAKPIKNYVGTAFGSGEQWQSWIHLNDLSRMFLFLVENNFKGVYNAVAPNPVTQNKLVKEIAMALERPLLLPNAPQFAIKLLLGEMAELLFSSQRVSSKKIEEKGFEFEFPNIQKALTHLYNKQEAVGLENGDFQKKLI